MSFLIEPEPPRGPALPVLPGIRRVVANNPSVMTYWGTNTYLIDAPDGVHVLDPGPEDAAHVAATVAAAGAPITAILISHGHHDHVGACEALRQATGAPVYAWHEPQTPGFHPDVRLQEGDRVGPWEVIHTPGHAADHICFAGPGGVLFSADHVMGWSSSVVGPPFGNMRQYFASLERLIARDDTVYLPGHGPPLPQPQDFVRALLAHRQKREDAILGALSTDPETPHALMERLYSKVDPALKRAAERNVLAHLQKLLEEGRARDTGAGWVRV